MADGALLDDEIPPVPVPITRVFDFFAWQANHPTQPLPGDKVNAELDRTNDSINLVAERLALIQRDDGQLQNDSIGVDQISDEALQEIVDEVAGDTLDEANAAAAAATMAAQAAENSKLAAEAAAAAAQAQVLPTLPAAPNSQVVTDGAGGSYVLAATILPLSPTAWDAGLRSVSRLGAPVVNDDAATKQYVDNSITASGGIPVPDTVGKVLTANGTVAGAFVWAEPEVTEADLAAVAVVPPLVTDVGKFLKATATSAFAWAALAWPDISGLIGANIATIATWLGLKSGAYTIVGSAATKDVGTGPNQIPQLDVNAKMPAVDGSQLTNIYSAVRVPVQKKVAAYPMVLGDVGTEIEFTLAGDLTLISAAAAGNGALVSVYNNCPKLDVPSYDNPLGQGDRTASIAVSSNIVPDAGVWANMVNGSIANTAAGGVDLPIVAAAGKYVEFDLGVGVKKFIDQITLTQSIVQTALFRYKASNDGVAYDIVSADFTPGLSSVINLVGVNPEGYRYWRIEGVSGNIANSWWQEFTFRIANHGYANDKVNLLGTVDGVLNRRMSPQDRTVLRSDGVTWRTARGVYTFESAEQALALSSVPVVAHGLGERPSGARAFFRCKIAEENWLVGDEIDYNSVLWTYGGSLQADAVNARATINQTYMPNISNKITAAGSRLTAANWRLVFYCEVRKG